MQPRYLITLLILLLATQAQARTWTVAKDGSGDYSVIQDALDVCAAGDSVLIGPGRYDDFHIQTFQVGGTAAMIMVPMVAPLTIIGSGMEEVLVGPEELTTEVEGHQTGVLAVDLPLGAERITVRGITLMNVNWLTQLYTPFTYEDCRFYSSAGLIGVGLGIALTRGIAVWAGWSTVVSLPAIALAFGVSALVGIVFGWYPARRAARLSPIDCLRYE